MESLSLPIRRLKLGSVLVRLDRLISEAEVIDNEEPNLLADCPTNHQHFKYLEFE